MICQKLIRQFFFLMLFAIPPVFGAEEKPNPHLEKAAEIFCKTAFFKLVAPAKILAAAAITLHERRGWYGFKKELGQIWKEDRYYLLGWAAIQAMLRGTYLSVYDFDRATLGNPCKLPGPILVVNIFEFGNPEGAEFEKAMRAKFACRKDVSFIRALDWSTAEQRINYAVANNGPFQTGVIGDHGEPGGLANSSMWQLSYKPQTGWFKPGAKLILRSCLVANGSAGDAYQERLGRAVLDKGGDVVASQVNVVTQVADVLPLKLEWDWSPPSFLQEIDSTLLAPAYFARSIFWTPWILPGAGKFFEAPPDSMAWPFLNPIKTTRVPPR